MFSDSLLNQGSTIRVGDNVYEVLEELKRLDSIYFYKVQDLQSGRDSDIYLLKLLLNNDQYFRECAILEKLQESKFILNPKSTQHCELYNLLIYEYPTHFTLGKYIKSNRIEEEILGLFFTKILIALDSIHKSEIFHLNIDENSIFVDKKNNILIGGFHEAVCLSDKNYSKQADLLNKPQILPPEFENNRNKPIYKASADIFILGVMLKQILKNISPYENFEHYSNEINQFTLSENCIGNYWKLIVRRMNEKNPLLRADVVEILGILSQLNMKIKRILTVNFESQLNVYYIDDFNVICKSLLYENSDLIDFPFLHRAIQSLIQDQSKLSDLSLIFRQSEFKSKPLVLLKIQAFLFYFYCSGVPYLFDPISRILNHWSNYSSFFNNLTEACHSPLLTTVSLHRELMIQMLQVLYFKEDLHTQSESSGDWKIFKEMEKPVIFSYLKRLNELFDLLARSLKTVPVLSSAIMFLCIDESLKSSEFFEKILSTTKNSSLLKEFEPVKKKFGQNLKIFHDLHQVRRQTYQNSFLFGTFIPEEYEKYEKTLNFNQYSILIEKVKKYQEIRNSMIKKDLKRENSPDLNKKDGKKCDESTHLRNFFKNRSLRDEFMMTSPSSSIYQEEDFSDTGIFDSFEFGELKLMSSRPEHSIFENFDEYGKVAIKIFNSSHPLSSSLFENELKILESLKHKNIVKLLKYENSDPNALVYTFYKGGTLHKIIHNSSYELSFKLKLEVAIQIAEAMKFVHSKGIIHRGLCSENILIENDFLQCSQVKIRVGGFGMAVFENSASQGIRSGLLYYRSPEMLNGQNVGFSTDVYSFAFLLYEMVTAKIPFDGEEDVWRMVVEEMIRPPLDGQLNEIKPVKSIIEVSWQQDPAMRPDFDWIIRELHKLKSDFQL